MTLVDLGADGRPCVVGQPCGGGRGICVAREGWGDSAHWLPGNASALSNNVTTGFCECAAGWSGKTDVLSFDGYACNVNLTAERVLHGFGILGVLISIVKHFKAWKAQAAALKRRRDLLARRGKTLPWYQFSSMVIVVLGTFVTNPGSLVLIMPRLLSMESRSVGSDLAVSIGLILSGPTGFMASSIHDVRLFKVVATGAGMRRKLCKQITTILKITYGAAVIAYLSVSCICVFAGFVLDPAPPSYSPMQFFLVLRNVITIAYVMTTLIIQIIVRNQTARVLASSSAAPSSGVKSAGNDALAALDHAVKSKLVSLIALVVVYTTFTVPSLWHLQSFPICIFVFLGLGGKTNPITSYVGGKATGRSSVGTTNSVQPSLAASTAVQSTANLS